MAPPFLSYTSLQAHLLVMSLFLVNKSCSFQFNDLLQYCGVLALYVCGVDNIYLSSS